MKNGFSSSSLTSLSTIVVFSEENNSSKGLHCFEIVTRARLYFLRFDTEAEMRLWFRCIGDARKIDEEEILRVRRSRRKWKGKGRRRGGGRGGGRVRLEEKGEGIERKGKAICEKEEKEDRGWKREEWE